jgi:hypothetical protein
MLTPLAAERQDVRRISQMRLPSLKRTSLVAFAVGVAAVSSYLANLAFPGIRFVDSLLNSRAMGIAAPVADFSTSSGASVCDRVALSASLSP